MAEYYEVQQGSNGNHNSSMIRKETALEAVSTIIQLHLEKTLEKKRAVDRQKKELWKLFQLFFIFLAVVFLGEAQSSSSSRLQCRHCWVPIGLLSLAHLIFYVAVAQTLRCINGFKYQRRCHKLTLGLATDRLRQLKQRELIIMGDRDRDRDREEHHQQQQQQQLLEIHYQEPPESYFGKLKRNWALHFGFLICIYAFMIASSVTMLCF